MDSAERKLMGEKRDDLMIKLLEEGYTVKQLSVIFNKHVKDVEKILKKHGYGLLFEEPSTPIFPVEGGL